MLLFVRKISFLMRIQKARLTESVLSATRAQEQSPERAFAFELTVKIKSGNIDPETGFSVSLAQVDKMLAGAISKLEVEVIEASEAQLADTCLKKVQLVLQNVSDSSMVLHAIELNSSLGRWTWTSPWRDNEKVYSQIFSIQTPTDEIQISLSSSSLDLDLPAIQNSLSQITQSAKGDAFEIHKHVSKIINHRAEKRSVAVVGVKAASSRNGWTLSSRSQS